MKYAIAILEKEITDLEFWKEHDFSTHQQSYDIAFKISELEDAIQVLRKL